MLWAVNVVAYLINAVVVGGSNFGWWGATNEEVSDDNPTFVTPAGWAFSIWGVIFLFELIFVVWGALPGNRDSRVVLEGVRCWFAIACVVQAAWSVVFAQELLVVSAILLCVIAFSLFMAVVSLSKIQDEEDITVLRLPYWGVYFPIGLHGGWTLAASLVNINLALELTDAGSELSALILIVVAAAIMASFGSLIFYNQPYLLAITWAIAGIAAKKGYRREQLGTDIAEGIDDGLQGLWVGLLCVGALGIIAGLCNRSGYEQEKNSPRRRTPSAPRSDGHGPTSAIFSS